MTSFIYTLSILVHQNEWIKLLSSDDALGLLEQSENNINRLALVRESRNALRSNTTQT